MTMQSLESFSLTALAFVASILSPITPVEAQQSVKRPNIVLIMADDLGYSDIAEDAELPNTYLVQYL